MSLLPFSRSFPSHHPRAGSPTFFVEKVLNQLGIDYRVDAYFGLLVSLNPNKDVGLLREFHSSLDRSHHGLKRHTIRNSKRFFSEALPEPTAMNAKNSFLPYVWSERPYNSPQINFAPRSGVSKTVAFGISTDGRCEKVFLNGRMVTISPSSSQESIDALERIAQNDGLTLPELLGWFEIGIEKKKQKTDGPFDGQVIIWDPTLSY